MELPQNFYPVLKYHSRKQVLLLQARHNQYETRPVSVAKKQSAEEIAETLNVRLRPWDQNLDSLVLPDPGQPIQIITTQ